jgi:hypothetical protein
MAVQAFAALKEDVDVNVPRMVGVVKKGPSGTRRKIALRDGASGTGLEALMA